MKKVLIICLLIISMLFIGIFSYQIKVRSELFSDFGKDLFNGRLPLSEINIISDFSLEEPESAKTILVLFNPECEACYNEILGFSNNKHMFKKYRLLLASTADSVNIATYISTFDLNSFASLKVGTINSEIFERYIIPYPSVLVYDEQGYFLKGYKGNVSIEKVIQ